MEYAYTGAGWREIDVFHGPHQRLKVSDIVDRLNRQQELIDHLEKVLRSQDKIMEKLLERELAEPCNSAT